MEINNLFGLPAHPLLVHAPIVLVPLCFVAAIFMAAKPEWRRRFGIPTAVLAVISAISVQLAIGSGEELEQRVRESNLIEKHSQFAELARPFVFLFAVALVGIVVWDYVDQRRSADASAAGTEVDAVAATSPSKSSKLISIAMVVTVLLGAAATYEIVQTGHSGAKATWHNTPAKKAGGEGGEGGEDRD
jgi:uncharacterized membrane protein